MNSFSEIEIYIFSSILNTDYDFCYYYYYFDMDLAILLNSQRYLKSMSRPAKRNTSVERVWRCFALALSHSICLVEIWEENFFFFFVGGILLNNIHNFDIRPISVGPFICL